MMACRRSPYQGDPRSYESYYGSQVGHGMPVFLGARVQRGHGLGNLFAGLVRAAMPLVKKGVKAIGKQGMKTGIQIAGDVFSGHKPKQAAKRRAKQAGLRLIGSALGQHPLVREPQEGALSHEDVMGVELVSQVVAMLTNVAGLQKESHQVIQSVHCQASGGKTSLTNTAAGAAWLLYTTALASV